MADMDAEPALTLGLALCLEPAAPPPWTCPAPPAVPTGGQPGPPLHAALLHLRCPGSGALREAGCVMLMLKPAWGVGYGAGLVVEGASRQGGEA